jgi:hypothetical protein
VVAFSGASVPVVLTMQSSTSHFRNVGAQLICKLGERFVLLAPTGRYVDANSLGLLAGAKAGFFDLETKVSFLPSGILQARKSGGELFSKFALEPARRCGTAIVCSGEATGIGNIMAQGASAARVPAYCMENLSRDEVAKRCGCVPSLVTRRLKAIEQKLGRKPTELRQFSSHFETMEESMRDTRAKRIYRPGLTDEMSEEE